MAHARQQQQPAGIQQQHLLHRSTAQDLWPCNIPPAGMQGQSCCWDNRGRLQVLPQLRSWSECAPEAALVVLHRHRYMNALGSQALRGTPKKLTAAALPWPCWKLQAASMHSYTGMYQCKMHVCNTQALLQPQYYSMLQHRAVVHRDRPAVDPTKAYRMGKRLPLLLPLPQQKRGRFMH